MVKLDSLHALDANGRRTFWSSFAGYAADSLDVQLYPFVLPILISVMAMSRVEAGILACAPMIFSAIGGWGAGLLADRIGRVRLLQFTILWFATFTFLCGLAQSYEQLLVLRCLQGLGFGGEWAVGSILVAEAAPPRHRGRLMGFIQSSWAVGWAGAALLATLILSLLPEAIAWRVLFFTGLAPALIALYVRRSVPESTLFLQTPAAKQREFAPALAIFQPAYRWSTLKALALATGAHGGYYAIAVWLPAYLLTERHLSITGTGASLGLMIFGAFWGYIVAACLCDYLGRRPTFVLFAIVSCVLVLAYTHLPHSDAVSALLGLPLGFFASGLYSGLGSLMSEIFPTELRASGQSFAYNFGRAIGSVFPVLVGAWSLEFPLGRTIGMFAAAAFSLVMLAALWLPETRGVELQSLAPEKRDCGRAAEAADPSCGSTPCSLRN